MDKAGGSLLSALAKNNELEDCIIHCEPLASDYAHDKDEGLIYKPRAVSEACKRAHVGCYEAMQKEVSPSNPLIALGGDHSIAVGTISGIFQAYADGSMSHTGLATREPVIIWFDAHADINTLKTTASGNIHGCPVAFLVDHPDTHGLTEFDWYYDTTSKYRKQTGNTGFIVPSRLAYIGLRDVEDGEKLTMEALDIHNAWFMEDIKENGRDIKAMMASILNGVDPEGERPIHLSFDVDGIDPIFTPSTGTPVPDGITLDEALEIVDILKGTGRLMSVDIVEVNLFLGTEEDSEKTLESTMKVLNRLLSE